MVNGVLGLVLSAPNARAGQSYLFTRTVLRLWSFLLWLRVLTTASARVKPRIDFMGKPQRLWNMKFLLAVDKILHPLRPLRIFPRLPVQVVTAKTWVKFLARLLRLHVLVGRKESSVNALLWGVHCSTASLFRLQNEVLA